MSAKKRVLVLCTGNSARSQMAEGLINTHLSDTWEAQSAGTEPAEQVHPLAVQAMAEIGIDISEHETKSMRDFFGESFDMVVTVCDNARKSCPAWLGGGLVEHMGFPDPSLATGSPEERLQVFRDVRDAIQERLLARVREVT
jgi:arsenate reductase (thioredoxin)